MLEREEGKERETTRDGNTDVREKHQSVVSHMRPSWGSNPQPRAYALTRNQTQNPVVSGRMLQPMEPSSQGKSSFFIFDEISSVFTILIPEVLFKLISDLLKNLSNSAVNYG